MSGDLGSFDPNIHVPGLWRCAKCHFQLVQSNLNAADGTVTPRDQAGDHCPNDGAPLWRVTWKEHAQAGWEAAGELTVERQDLRSAAIDFVVQVQGEVLTRDEILASFDLAKLDRLLWLCDPSRPRSAKVERQ